MFYSLRRFIFSVKRLGASHGFGIQSPFAYQFVTEVVRDKKYHGEYSCLQHGNRNHGQRIRLQKFYVRLTNYLNTKETLGDVVVVEGIHESKQAYLMWREVIKMEKVGVSFDLYDCGVVFFDKRMHKINYEVMLV